MKLKTILFLFCVFTTSYGQTDSLTVINTIGLELRADSTNRAEILYKIPYLSKVNVLEDRYPVNYENVSKRWTKVKFLNHIGYVNDLYLFPITEVNLVDKVSSPQNEFALTFAKNSSFYNIHRNEKIKWKGVFKEENQYLIKNISVTYYKTPGQERYKMATTSTDINNLHIILGTTKDIYQNGPISGEYNDYFEGIICEAYKRGECHTNYEFFSARLDKQKMLHLTLIEGKQEQTFEPRKIDGSVSLLWKGDLDKDKKDDYIIQYGVRNATVVLYLSSQAEGNEIVKPVAYYISG